MGNLKSNEWSHPLDLFSVASYCNSMHSMCESDFSAACLQLNKTTNDLWLTQMLKWAIMQLVMSLWCTALVSTVTPLSTDVINARHKEGETAKEGRWGVMSSCLKWLSEGRQRGRSGCEIRRGGEGRRRSLISRIIFIGEGRRNIVAWK